MFSIYFCALLFFQWAFDSSGQISQESITKSVKSTNC